MGSLTPLTRDAGLPRGTNLAVTADEAHRLPRRPSAPWRPGHRPGTTGPSAPGHLPGIPAQDMAHQHQPAHVHPHPQLVMPRPSLARLDRLQLGMSPQIIRHDRILDEAHATSGDIRTLVDLFGLSIGGAEPYMAAVSHSNSAKAHNGLPAVGDTMSLGGMLRGDGSAVVFGYRGRLAACVTSWCTASTTTLKPRRLWVAIASYMPR